MAMKAVAAHAKAGGLVIGICNGFQILCEAHLLPGALVWNKSLKFICAHIHLRVETTHTPFANACRPGQVLCLPIAHGEGCYFAEPAVIARWRRNSRTGVPLR